jgi:hypothetical protein
MGCSGERVVTPLVSTTPDCTCGQKHSFRLYPYLDVPTRPSGWILDPAIEVNLPEIIGELSSFGKAKAEKLDKELYSKKRGNFANIHAELYIKNRSPTKLPDG